MQEPNDSERENLMRTMLSDCERFAEFAQGKLDQVVEHLREGNHLAALGAFDGLDDAVLYIGTVLKRLARITRKAR